MSEPDGPEDVPQLPARRQLEAWSLLIFWLLVATFLGEKPLWGWQQSGHRRGGQQEVVWVKPWAQHEPNAQGTEPGLVAEKLQLIRSV